ncbi:histone-lysine N-methyltransferase SETMAR-like [Harpegnathos saltator]|uniref:histone-lysine N-methyltransferase SETMAR-like n=1 Tax=Harpegnathos saltator TaxID=610380 RepID=UPI000DBEDAC7|nr:histone-lysine N-methyltransferase SETMAR-like [Harpegnathos saltator]
MSSVVEPMQHRQLEISTKCLVKMWLMNVQYVDGLRSYVLAILILKMNYSGRPETKVDNDELKAVVEADTSQTTRELAARFNVTIPMILDHLKQIGKRSAQWLNIDEVQKPNIHKRKLMVSVWWSNADIIRYSFMKPGQSITADVYCNELDEMMRMLEIKQLRLVNRDRPILLQDNARSHVQTTLLKLQQLDLETLCHPLYSPDLTPTDYHFFQALDHFLQGKIFSSQQAVENIFRDFIIICSSGFFAAGMNKLPLRWQNCIDILVHTSINFTISGLRYNKPSF